MELWPDMQKQLILSLKLVYLYGQSSASLLTDLTFLLFYGLLLSNHRSTYNRRSGYGETEWRGKKKGLTLYRLSEYPKWGHLLSQDKNSQTLSDTILLLLYDITTMKFISRCLHQRMVFSPRPSVWDWDSLLMRSSVLSDLWTGAITASSFIFTYYLYL